MPVTYPISADVLASQPTAYQHYNNLRADALRFGAGPLDAVTVGQALIRYADNIVLIPLATNRVAVAYDAAQPATLMIDGHLCQATAEIDLAPGLFSGGAMQWYIFANWTAGSTTFTLSINTSVTEAANQRRIGSIYWDGANCVYPSLFTLAQGRPAVLMAKVNRTAVFSIPATITTAISFDTEEVDTDGMYSGGAPTKITIVHPGYYICVFNLNMAASTGISWVHIRINGGAEICSMLTPAAQKYNIAAVRHLVAGDYLEACIYAASGPTNTATPTNLTVAALSA